MPSPLPSLTRQQVRRIDAIAIEELGIPGVVLMENAGRNAADVIAGQRSFYGGTEVVIFAGPGNNGGDGFVIARHLSNRGVPVRVFLAGARDRLRGDAAIHFTILEKCGSRVPQLTDEDAVDAAVRSVASDALIVDGLLGTGFRGDVRPLLAALIERLNGCERRGLVALDIPSGLDCDAGTPTNATIRANLTVTFAARKVGFDQPGAEAFTGGVVVADIGVPPSLIERVARES